MNSPAAAIVEIDGATVSIVPNGLPGGWHYRPDAYGYYAVYVTIWEKDVTWARVATNATVHVLVPKLEYEASHSVSAESISASASVEFQDWVETAVVPFTSRTDIAQLVQIPLEAVVFPDGLEATVVRTYVELDDGRIGHHNAAKNVLIGNGLQDAADALDGIYQPSIAT